MPKRSSIVTEGAEIVYVMSMADPNDEVDAVTKSTVTWESPAMPNDAATPFSNANLKSLLAAS